MAGTAGISKDGEERSRHPSHGGRSRPAHSRPTDAGLAAGAAKLAVREGEQRWSEAELAGVRARLETEISELRAEITRAESEIAARLTDAVGDAGDDQADAGAKTYQREHDLALTHNARELLAQNERALDRMADGTYGICESCGDPIGKARLQAFPRATLCVQCKQREERR
jgi:RNA polymerase-binding transcription factor